MAVATWSFLLFPKFMKPAVSIPTDFIASCSIMW
jgi:hypothetical protein